MENLPSLNNVLFPVTSINKHSISVQSTGQMVTMHWKHSKHSIPVQSTGQLVTVRGCSSFDSQTFPVALQQAMVGDYWNVSHMILMTLVIVMMTLMIMMTILMFIWASLQSDNVFSICDYAGCNSAKSLQIEILTVLLLLAGSAVLNLWFFLLRSFKHKIRSISCRTLLFATWCVSEEP